MKLLILGGTQFVGRTITQAAIDNGHEVTLFNRGNTNPHLFPDLEKLRGDRDSDLAIFDGRTWDAVIDVNGYLPRIVKLSAEKLADKVGLYAFISTISVYQDSAANETPGITEDGPLNTLEDPTVEEITGATYGGLKVLCEQAAEAAMPGKTLIVRPGLVVGPNDHTDRFTYWPVRTARGGTMLAPPRDAVSQVIDVRDLAAFTLKLVEAGAAGSFNGVGEVQTYGDVLDACVKAAGDRAAAVINADEAFLTEKEVAPWSDLPLWLPSSMNGMAQISNAKAIDNGMTYHSIEATAVDTLAWFEGERGLDSELKYGMKPEKETELLTALQNR